MPVAELKKAFRLVSGKIFAFIKYAKFFNRIITRRFRSS